MRQTTKRISSASIVGKKKGIGRNTKTEELKAEELKSGELKAFLTGETIPLKEVGDGVFSEGVMGDGLAIIPEGEILRI